MDIVDFHAHLWPKEWGPGGRYAKPSIHFAPDIHRRILDPAALLAEFSESGISLGVVSTTIESLFEANGPTDTGIINSVNDWLAELVATHPRKLAALGTIDAFSGERGAQEVERAITTLKLSGIVIDSSRRGLFLNDPVVRPTLEAAAHHKVPIFVHPVSLPDSAIYVAGAGMLGNSLGRGLMNGVALLSILQSDLIETLPDLQLVFATLGAAAIVQAARGGRYSQARRKERPRPNIYFDTMGQDPAIIRILVDFFGAERIVAGTDWPILPGLTRSGFTDALVEAGLSPTDQVLVAADNARRLLKLS